MSPAGKDGGDAPEDRADPRVRFSGAAAGYARFRPGYPDALVDWVVSEAAVREGDAVADVACGTGILSRMLADRGFRTVALVFRIRPAPGRTS